MKRLIRATICEGPVKLTNPPKEFVQTRVAISGVISQSLQSDENVLALAHAPHGEPAVTHSADETPEDGVEAGVHCKQFAEALQSFEESLPDDLKTRCNLQDKHTWKDVINEAEVAEIKYNKKAEKESPFGPVRGLFRKLRSNSPAIQNWLNLLPKENQYGSLICGGLKIILRAATRMGEIKEFAVGALAAIPDEIEKAQLLIEYNLDQDSTKRLYNSVSSLYSAIFDVLNKIIEWYKERSAKRHLKALLQQDIYEKKLEDKVEAFRAAVSAVKDEAEICGFRRLQNIDETGQRTNETLQKLELLLRSSPLVNFQTGQLLNCVLAHTDAGYPAAPKRRAISRQSLCDAVLRYEEDIPLTDLATTLLTGSTLTLKAQDRIVYVIESEALKSWLLSSRNTALMIRGNLDEVLENSPCAISFVAAHIIQSTQQMTTQTRAKTQTQIQPTTSSRSRVTVVLSLFWFARQHQNTRNDAEANVHGVMRSLIGQLLRAYDNFDLYFIKRKHAAAIREDNDLAMLCDVFDNLIFQLPRNTVTVCVLDWLACLEYQERQEVRYVLGRLLAVVRYASENEGGSIFKLLLTQGAGGTFWAASLFEEVVEKEREKKGKGQVKILDVPDEGIGNRMGFNQLLWDVHVDDKFKRLVATKHKR